MSSDDVWEDDNGDKYVVTQKGIMALLLADMVPNLDIEDAADLVTQLIEDACDRADVLR
jgi:hypothetical protein